MEQVGTPSPPCQRQTSESPWPPLKLSCCRQVDYESHSIFRIWSDPINYPDSSGEIFYMQQWSSTLAWRTPWTEEPGLVTVHGIAGVRHDLVTEPPPPPPTCQWLTSCCQHHREADGPVMSSCGGARGLLSKRQLQPERVWKAQGAWFLPAPGREQVKE